MNSKCSVCKHYYMSYRCDAFPDRIPEDIAIGEVSHISKHSAQDNDIVFEHYLIEINNDVLVACM